MRTRHAHSTTLRPALLAIALAAVASFGCGDSTGVDGRTTPGNRSYDDSFQWRGRVAEGDHIAIRGIAGSIRASLASGNEVVVTATKSGPVDRRRRVAIDVQPHAGGVTICAVYPDAWGEPANVCGQGSSGRIDLQDDDVEITFTVQVPAGVVFLGSTVAGNVEASGLRSDAFVTTVAGNLRVVTSRLAEATTVSGSVTASIGLTDWDRDLRFSTTTGDVTVQVPAATNAEVHASTVNGGIESAFALTQVSPGRMRGSIGSGGRMLTLSAVNGNIRLRRGS